MAGQGGPENSISNMIQIVRDGWKKGGRERGGRKWRYGRNKGWLEEQRDEGVNE